MKCYARSGTSSMGKRQPGSEGAAQVRAPKSMAMVPELQPEGCKGPAAQMAIFALTVKANASPHTSNVQNGQATF
jgi:hypothetical protein